MLLVQVIDMPRITVSFKHNKEDLELYNEIMKHSDRSGFIKDILKGRIVDRETKVVDRIVDREIKDFSFEQEAYMLFELTPALKVIIIASTSAVFATACAFTTRTKSFGYDTITDLKKRAKHFNKTNYSEKKKS